MLKRSPAIDFPEHRTELRLRGVEPVTYRLDRTDGSVRARADDNGTPPALTCSVRRAPRPAMAPNESSTAVVVKRICSTSRPTSAARPSPLAASSNTARSRVPARSRGQRTAIRISVADGMGAGRRGVAVRRAARKIAVTAGSAVGEAKPLWRCLSAIAVARRLSVPRAQRLRAFGQKGRNRGGIGRKRDQALLAAPILECPPIHRVEPLCLGTGVSVAPHCDRCRRIGGGLRARLIRFRSIGRVQIGIGLNAGRRCVGQRRSLRRHLGCLRSPVFRLPLSRQLRCPPWPIHWVEHDSCRDSNRFTRLWQALLRRGKLSRAFRVLPRAWECFAPPSSGRSDERPLLPRPDRTEANPPI